MIGTLRQLLEPRLRQQARIEKSQTPVERDILIQSVRMMCMQTVYDETSLFTFCCLVRARVFHPSDLRIKKKTATVHVYALTRVHVPACRLVLACIF